MPETPVNSAAPMSDWYLLCILLETPIVLLKSLHDTVSSSKDPMYFKSPEDDIQDVLELVVFWLCWLQRMFAGFVGAETVKPISASIHHAS
jgi:hypothetical protein